MIFLMCMNTTRTLCVEYSRMGRGVKMSIKQCTETRRELGTCGVRKRLERMRMRNTVLVRMAKGVGRSECSRFDAHKRDVYRRECQEWSYGARREFWWLPGDQSGSLTGGAKKLWDLSSSSFSSFDEEKENERAQRNKQEIVRAMKDGTLSFGFSAGGCLFPYYVGVVAALQEEGILGTDTKLGGASAGSLIAACVKSGMKPTDIAELTLKLLHDCRTHGTRGRLGPTLRRFLEDGLPEDAHTQCNGKAYVAVTKAAPFIESKLVSEYHHRQDLIDALMTSCHIPYWLDGKPVTRFRNGLHLDGGLTNFIPLPPESSGVRVCCFPSKRLNYSNVYSIGISPDSFEPWPYTLGQMIRWAFEPASENICMFLIEKGEQDAKAWIKEMGLEDSQQDILLQNSGDGVILRK